VSGRPGAPAGACGSALWTPALVPPGAGAASLGAPGHFRVARHAAASFGYAAADGSLSPGARGPQRPLCSGGARRPVRRREGAAWPRACVPLAGTWLPVLRLSARECRHRLDGGRGFGGANVHL